MDYIIGDIQLKRGTAANWTAANPILLDGQEGYETDTKLRKVGDGVTAWNSLSYTPAGVDSTGIHKAVNSEIHSLTEKTSLVDSDELLGENSASSYSKVRIRMVNIANYVSSLISSTFQPLLVSGTNIKTVNSTSLLGTGNIIITGGGPGSDTTAIHNNVASEINSVTEDTTVVGNDVVLFEDSTALYVKKKFKLSTLATYVNGLLGTASTKNVPVSGNASSTEVVKGDDTRLTNSRTPSAHASTHVTGGSDVIANVIAAGNSGLMSGSDKTKLDGIASGANVGVVPNIAITGATKTKITYDAKGLILSGADATTTDITEGTNLYFTTPRVLATQLAGLSTATSSVITASDTLLSASGKLQAQINTLSGTVGSIVSFPGFGVTGSTAAYGNHTHSGIYQPVGSYEVTSNKDISGGYVGMTLFKHNFRNVANTFTSFLTNSNTAARTYTFQDSDGTIAHLSDISGLVPTSRTLTINGTTFDLTANRTWTITATGTPGGSNTQIQFNNSGVLGGDSKLIYDYTNKRLGIGGTPSYQLDIKGTNGNMYFVTDWSSGFGSWLNISTDGPSGIGSGGAGANAWIGYASGINQWFTGSAAGDLCYRNGSGHILMGNSAYTISIYGDKVGIKTLTPAYTLDVAGDINISTGSVFRINGVAVALNGVPTTRNITINGTTQDLSIDRTWTISASATAGGATTNIQYNVSGVISGEAALSWDYTNKKLLITQSLASSNMPGLIVQNTSTSSLAAVRIDILNDAGNGCTFFSPSALNTSLGLQDAGCFSSYKNMCLFTDSGVSNGGSSIFTIRIGGYSASQEKFRITTTAVGIFNTSPTELLTLGTAGTTKGTLSFAGNTSGKIIIQPQAAAGTYTLTLPNTAGTNGYYLQTDGAGNLGWGTGGGSASVSIGSVITSGTAGSVLYVNGAGQLAQTNASFYYDYNNNRLGIGTNTPSTPLHVVGNTTINGDVTVVAVNGRIWGIGSFGTGMTVSFQYGGDSFNTINNTYNSYAEFKAYHGVLFSTGPSATIVAKLGNGSGNTDCFFYNKTSFRNSSNAPTATIHVGPNQSTVGGGQIKLEGNGALLSTVVDGTFEYINNGTDGHLYFTRNISGTVTRVMIM